MKRNTALIKKLRGISEENKDSLCEDILKVNQIRVGDPLCAGGFVPCLFEDSVEMCESPHHQGAFYGCVDIDEAMHALFCWIRCK